MSDAGSERGGRRGYEPSDGKVRDFSNWERRGPLAPAAGPAPTLREGGRQQSKDGPPNFRRNSPAWGEGRSQDGSRPPRREYTEKPPVERQPTAPELDNQWRARMQPDAPAKSPTPETSAPPSPRPTAAAPPTSRPKLNLQKRTVSEADPATSPAASGDTKASPFGAARPVDTAAKERELAEKRQIAVREKREAEEKAKAERAEEKRLAREKGDTEKPTDTPTSPRAARRESQSREEGEEAPAPTPKFDILRRVDSGTNDMLAEEENEEEEEVQLPVDDKAVKPKEVVVDTPSSQTNGAWRNNKGQKKAEETTTETMEEEGWSTVSKPTKQRNNRRNNLPTRALAS